MDYSIPAGGSREITIENSADGVVTLTVWSNGDYSITSTKNIDSEVTYDLSYTVTDADGDISTADLKIVLQDTKPEAFDNVAAGPDSDYQNTSFILDDFGSRTSGNPVWHASNNSVMYNTRLSNGAAFTDINGNPAITSGSDSFVKISATSRDDSTLNFNSAVKDAVGQSISDLFGGYAAQSGGMIEQSFDLYTAGTIAFNFILDRGTNSSREQAFAILKNEKGEIVWKGLIAAGTIYDKHGLCEIPVDCAGNYTLYIGCYDTQVHSGYRAPKLYVDKVVFAPTEAADVYHGNVIEDASPFGETDKLGDHAVLHMVRINGVEYAVSTFVNGLLVLDNVFDSGDKLTVNDNGNYVYQTAPGSSFDNVTIEYAIKEPGSSDMDWATLYIRSDGYKFEGATHVGQHTGGNDVIIGADGGVTLDGGAGDDLIYGGTGNDILYGGTGNDVLYGGAGSDAFVWKAEDYDNGTDVIMDFTLREDRLSFADIFGDSEVNIVSLRTILDALSTGKVDISVDALDDSLLKMTVNNGTNTQNVDIHLADCSLTSTQIADINTGDDAAKAALLQQMLTVITG